MSLALSIAVLEKNGLFEWRYESTFEIIWKDPLYNLKLELIMQAMVFVKSYIFVDQECGPKIRRMSPGQKLSSQFEHFLLKLSLAATLTVLKGTLSNPQRHMN